MFNRGYAVRGTRQAVVLGVLLFCGLSCVHAEDVIDDAMLLQQPQQPLQSNAIVYLLDRYPVGSIAAMATANRAIKDVKTMRAIIDGQFATEQNDCHQKFFATACLLDAKERHRTALDRLRRIEIEANKFKRRANVAERDRVLTAKRDKDVVVQSSTVTKNSNQVLEESGAISQEMQQKNHADTNQRIKTHLDGAK